MADIVDRLKLNEKQADRLDRIERSLKDGLAAISYLVSAFENENASGDRIKAVQNARAKIDYALKTFKKD